MTYKILVLDIDGTVTNSEKEITPKTLEAIIHIQKRGHKVVLASGRPTPGIRQVAKQLKLEENEGYILSYNGAKVIDCKSEEIIYQKVLPKNMIPILYKEAIDHNLGIISYDNDVVIAGTKIDQYIEKEAAINQMPIKKVDNFTEYITYDVNKCLMTGEPTYLAGVEKELNEKYGDRLSIYRSEPYFLEIMPQNIDKAHSLEKLLEYLKLKQGNMIAVGDGYNDLSMIEYAGLGVAMENAQEVVKKSADYITRSNDEDGVAHVIKKYML